MGYRGVGFQSSSDLLVCACVRLLGRFQRRGEQRLAPRSLCDGPEAMTLRTQTRHTCLRLPARQSARRPTDDDRLHRKPICPGWCAGLRNNRHVAWNAAYGLGQNKTAAAWSSTDR